MVMTKEGFRSWRARSGYNQQELARKLGVTQAYISQMETGKRLIQPDIEKKIRELTPKHSLTGDDDGQIDNLQAET